MDFTWCISAKGARPLTGEKLKDLAINGIRLFRFKNGDIGMEFIWIDADNPPQDAIGWVSESQSSLEEI